MFSHEDFGAISNADLSHEQVSIELPLPQFAQTWRKLQSGLLQALGPFWKV